jgi:prepilin-type N-terminal cleavage/methylation domain-containing protein
MAGRTILSAGSNPETSSSRNGFTLFEIVVAVVILSVGIVAIYEALIVSVNGFSYYSNALTIQSWMGRKLWEAQDKLVRGGSEATVNEAGTFQSGNKDVQFNLEKQSVIDGGLYELRLECSWREGGRNVSVSRAAYAAI